MNDKKKTPSVLLLGTQMTRAGAQVSLLKLARGLHARGWQVTAAFLYDKDGLCETWQAAEDFPVLELGFWRKGAKPWDFWRLLRGAGRLLRLMRGGHFDLAMTYTQHCNLVGIPAAWLAGIPVRVASNRGYIDGIPDWLSRLHGRMVNSPMTTCLVGNSAHVRREAIRTEHVNAKKIVVIPNGVPLPELTETKADRISVRAEFNLPPETPILLTVGRLTRQKGHVYLLDALPEIRRVYPQIVLLAVGDSELRPALEAQARRLGVADGVHFIGMRDDVPRLLRAADIFLFPTLWEGMPNALLEAMAYGLPCAASTIPEVLEVLAHGESGWLFPPRQSAPLAQAVIALLGDADLRRRIARGARTVVEQKYSVAVMDENYAGLFERLLAESS